jgi:uncharacterized protein YutE (UPF0331/DUF86 family)
MPLNPAKIKSIMGRTDELVRISDSEDDNTPMRSFQFYMGIVNLVSKLYGVNSQQMKELVSEKNRLLGLNSNEYKKHQIFIRELKGFLDTIVSDIKSGLIEEIEDEARGEIYTDFIKLSKEAIEKGGKDVAAVLASAALEDSLKRFAESKGLNVENKDMSEVISIIKSAELLQKPEAKVVQSYVTLRNKALHADWDKINLPEVASLIGFVESFVLLHFSGDNS